MLGNEIYLIRSTGERRDQLLEAASRNGFFAEAVDDDLHRKGGPPLPCLISFQQGRITHSATLFVGNKAAEGSKRVNVRDLVELPESIRTAALVDLIEPPDKGRLQEQLRQTGLISGNLADKLLAALRVIDPALAAKIARFAAGRDRVNALPPRLKAALGVEKEMLAAALSFAGIDRDELRSWSLPDDAGSSFLDGLDQVRLREDAMVVNDMNNVPGFDFIRTVARSAAVFENNETRLTVILANHLAIEQQLGGDLVYFNEKLKAFTIVQYKAMEKDDIHGAIFRLPNEKLSEEIARMRHYVDLLRSSLPNDHSDGFRLHENPFYLKLCPRLDFDPGEIGLIKGMYLPLDYWDLLSVDPRNVGPRGGRLLSFENVRRYFDNTSFIYLVANGWVGTSMKQSEMLMPIVKELVRTGRPLTVAVASEAGPRLERKSWGDGF